MKHRRPAPEGPFSRFMSASELSGLPGGTIVITANEAERAALAAVNELVGIGSFDAKFKVSPGNRDFHLTGEARARIIQTCVVSLDEFESDVVEIIDIRFAAPAPPAPAGKNKGNAGKAAPRLADLGDEGLEHNPPEPMNQGHIDLGAVAAEFFALGLDPYPRKPGADFEVDSIAPDNQTGARGETVEDKRDSRFAALARLGQRGTKEP